MRMSELMYYVSTYMHVGIVVGDMFVVNLDALYVISLKTFFFLKDIMKVF